MNKIFVIILIAALQSFISLPAVEFDQDIRLLVNRKESPSAVLSVFQKEVDKLAASIGGTDNKQTTYEYYHIVDKIDSSDAVVILQDESKWQVGWWYSGVIKTWEQGQRVKISYHSENYSNQFKLENIDTKEIAWGEIQKYPNPQKRETISRMPNGQSNPDAWQKLILKSGWIFKHAEPILAAAKWDIKDEIFVFHHAENEGLYSIWNLKKGQVISNWQLVGNEKNANAFEGNLRELISKDVLTLEERLNKRVLAQPEATQAVSQTMINYCAGLKDPKTPISVFLFLGPTGVGKTELAKVLTDEIYKDPNRMTRLDMSHYSEQYSSTRLIGSPPGYVNHEEGGQLTEAIKEKPQSVVLLDEFEKAHPTIMKYFLPVFDEGFIVDSKGIHVECKDVIFVLTSNVCSQEILTLFNQGYDADEVLKKVEPSIIKAFSPEVYNRLTPIVFHPLRQDAMAALVELQLKEVSKRLKATRNIELTLDESAKEYLIENGYHPSLGARPLKKLIEKKIVGTLAQAIIAQNIPNGSQVFIAYTADNDTWHIDWLPSSD